MTKELTTAEAAQRLGLSPTTLQHQIKRGKLAATKRGRDYFISLEALEAYEREHRGGRGWARRKQTTQQARVVEERTND